MKYPYYVEYSEFGSPILRLPEEIGLVTAFLFSDVQGPLCRIYSPSYGIDGPSCRT